MSDGKVVFEITGDLSGISTALDEATLLITDKTAQWTALAQAALNGLSSRASHALSRLQQLSVLDAAPLHPLARGTEADASVSLQRLQTEIAQTLQSDKYTINIAHARLSGGEADIQRQLNAFHLSVRVGALLSGIAAGLTGSLLPGLTGTSHAAGGIFPGTTRFLHTAGESGAEALLPLDTLWRKMGLIFDQTFAANLDGLQYSVMPALPAADPQPRMEAADMDRLADRIVSAMSGLTVEMDKKTVGRILKPVVSREMEQDVKARRWTS